MICPPEVMVRSPEVAFIEVIVTAVMEPVIEKVPACSRLRVGRKLEDPSCPPEAIERAPLRFMLMLALDEAGRSLPVPVICRFAPVMLIPSGTILDDEIVQVVAQEPESQRVSLPDVLLAV
jgi:hypothetical protein